MNRLLSFLSALLVCLSVAAIDLNDDHLYRTRLDFWLDMSTAPSSEENMQTYVASMDSLDIAIDYPSDFVPCPKPNFMFSPDTAYHAKYYNLTGIVGWTLVGPIVASPANDALIVYPSGIDSMLGMSPAGLVEAEMIAAHGNEFIDITDMITVSEDTGGTNADWIMQYEYDVVTPEWGEHPHCVGLALRKKNHYALPIKILLNDEGLQHKDEYIAIALSSVRYGDQPKPEWIEEENLIRSDELKFPKEKRKFVPGIIVDK